MEKELEKKYNGEESRKFKSLLTSHTSDEGHEVMIAVEVGFLDENKEVIEKPWVTELALKKIHSFIKKLYHAHLFPVVGSIIETDASYDRVIDIEYKENGDDVIITFWLN